MYVSYVSAYAHIYIYVYMRIYLIFKVYLEFPKGKLEKMAKGMMANPRSLPQAVEPGSAPQAAKFLFRGL